jgi:hypothetical protein
MDNKKYEALKKAMEKYGEALVLEIVQQLKNSGKEATGNLVRSIDYELIEALDTISIGIKAENYLDYVDGGRRKGANPPPQEAILKWLSIRGIKGRSKSGKTKGRFITQKSG